MSQQRFSLCGLLIEVQCQGDRLGARLRDSWRRLYALQNEDLFSQAPTVHIELKGSEYAEGPLPVRKEASLHQTANVLNVEKGFRIQYGLSALDFDLPGSYLSGQLDAQFWCQSLQEQGQFFHLALVMLFRRHGLYGLHANGLVRDGAGFLTVASSGGGKTTLAIALIRQGWSCLSDDGLMLMRGKRGIEALAFRSGLVYAPSLANHFPELGTHLKVSPSASLTNTT